MTNLEILKDVHNCSRCQLREGLSDPLFPCCGKIYKAKIMLIKYCPDYDAHLLELPYNTQEELTIERIAKVLNLYKSEIYVTNALKCSNTLPIKMAREVLKTCKTHLEREIEAVEPKIICSLGKLTKNLLDKLNISTIELPSLNFIYNMSNTKLEKIAKLIHAETKSTRKES